MEPQDAQSTNAYIEAVVAEARAVICSAYVSGFQAEFARSFAAWRAANAELINRGKRLIAEKASDVSGVQGFASMQAQVLESLPDDDRQRRCDELLKKFMEAKRS